MNDLISRQTAIDEVKRLHDVAWENWKETRISANTMIDALKDLPSAQPEIIHCKKCKYGAQDEDKRWYCRGLGCQVGEADGSGFCADAERRTNNANIDT